MQMKVARQDPNQGKNHSVIELVTHFARPWEQSLSKMGLQFFNPHRYGIAISAALMLLSYPQTVN